MTEHIVALFQTESAAAAAERDLETAGISSSTIRRYSPSEMENLEPGTFTAGTAETSHSSRGGFWAWLMGETANTQSAYSTDGDMYDTRARAGNTVLSVMLDDDSLIQRAVTVLDAHHPIEIEEHTHETGTASDSEGSLGQSEAAGKTSLSPSGVDYSTSAVATPAVTMGSSATAAPVARGSGYLPPGVPGSGRVAPAPSAATGEEVIALAEEKLEVGKRVVDRGTTRVRRYVVEKPVEQNVTLHGERVTIERRRPVEGTSAAGGTFEERTIEVQETEEVPVVGKTTHIVEEVAIRKEATERTETIKDTLRREEVEVEPARAETEESRSAAIEPKP